VTQSSLTVIKVGGSLFNWPELPGRLTELLAVRRALDRDGRMVLIAGGGAAADMVRVVDEIHSLGDETAHWLALRAMDLTASILAKLLPGTVLADSLGAMRLGWAAGSVPVLAVCPILDEIERSRPDWLPASWDVTSDTIAAWLTLHLGGDRLMLLKSAPLPDGADRQEAARLGLVDPMLPLVARTLARIEYVNLRDHAYQPQILA
jgi:5-(aminomethyl)-3-furanmethanol phosphate kinase